MDRETLLAEMCALTGIGLPELCEGLSNVPMCDLDGLIRAIKNGTVSPVDFLRWKVDRDRRDDEIRKAIVADRVIEAFGSVMSGCGVVLTRERAAKIGELLGLL